LARRRIANRRFRRETRSNTPVVGTDPEAASAARRIRSSGRDIVRHLLLGERTSQRGSGSRQVALHGPLVDPERRGDLARIHLEHVPQDRGLALASRQPGDRGPDVERVVVTSGLAMRPRDRRSTSARRHALRERFIATVVTQAASDSISSPCSERIHARTSAS
jgi:hypothetical protein